MHWHAVATVSIALSGACAAGGATVPAGREVELAPRATVTIANTGHAITFVGVRADSRCPSDVTCVWAGNAAVEVRVRSAATDTLVTLNTGIEPRAAVAGTIRVELLALLPHPVSTTTVATDAYRATLVARPAN